MILFLVLLLLLIAVLGGAFYAYYVAFYSPKSKRNLPPRFDRKSYAPYRGELESGYQQLRQRRLKLPIYLLRQRRMQQKNRRLKTLNRL